MAFKSNFKPDIVLSNPPYKSGVDIDFVFSAFKIAKIAIGEITPAKWQACEENQKITSTHSYGDFRKHIVPYIYKLIFYPDIADIFEIRNVDGSTIYFCNTYNKVNNCDVINRSLNQTYFNSQIQRDIKNRQTLHNIGNEIVEYLGNYETYHFKLLEYNKRYQVWTGNQINSGNGWGYLNRKNPCGLLNLDGAFKCLGTSIIIDIHNNEIDNREKSTCLFESDNIENCKSFISWLDSKLVRFLVSINIGKLTNVFTNDYFRFVPKPFREFNSLYTDTEIYSYYKLKQYHIDVIESVISNR